MDINSKKIEEFMLFCQDLQKQKDPVESKESLIKLEAYNSLLFDCFLWQHRDLYLNLFKSFLNYNISGEQFSTQLINMRVNHISEFDDLMRQLKINFESLNKINLDLNAFGFTDIIDLVDQNCDSFVSDELLVELGKLGEGDSREDGEIDETQLRERIEKAFLLIMGDK